MGFRAANLTYRPSDFIAATALEHGLTVVTRNVADFAPTGAPTFDPIVGGQTYTEVR